MKYIIAFMCDLLTLPFTWAQRYVSLRSVRMAGILGVLLPFAVAHAHHVEDKCVRSDSGKSLDAVVTMPITVNIGRDAQIGEAIGPWFTHAITWTCTRTAIPAPPDKHAYQPPNDFFEVQTRIYPVNMVDKGDFLADPSFRVYGYGTYNIGFIAKVTQEVEGGAAVTTHINHLPIGSYFETMLANNIARQHGDVSKFHLTLQVRLVKLAGSKPPKTIHPHLFNTYVYSYSKHPDAPPYKKHQSGYGTYLKGTVHNIGAACTTPTVHVPLGKAHAGNLMNVNDAGPITDFNLRFENCPAYMHSVRYRFQSVPQQAIANGTLPLDPILSNASGVGVQVLKADGTPQVFDNTFIDLSDYDAFNPLPLYQVPMKARIIRTMGPLQGGEVHAAMKMVVRYQ